MSAANLNHVVITGNLTSDPELRPLPCEREATNYRNPGMNCREGAG